MNKGWGNQACREGGEILTPESSGGSFQSCVGY